MRVPLKWVAKYTDIDIPEAELISNIFTHIGSIERIENLEEKYKGIIIAEIVDAKEHPDSDKLGIYRINIGDREVQVVAGDRSLKKGDKVAYFPVGTKVPYNAHPEKGDAIVGKVTLRGIESEGMMASEKELDLGPDHTGVMKIEEDFKPGTSFAKAYELEDTIIDIENKALVNRGDCFGILGIAREVAAIQKKPFVSPEWYKTPKKPKTSKRISLEVTNNAEANCPRYMAVVMDGIKIKKSPQWLRIALVKSGIKPINNVVDITNYLMLLTSQPLHAFDYDKVVKKDPKHEAHIVVRGGKVGEKLMALNDKGITLDESITVICDSENAIGIAGIMGGKDTEIDDSTTRIIIECALFNRYNIRKSSWKLGLFTDAATRYTKPQDPNQCEPVLYEAIRLVNELTEGEIASEIVDHYKQPYVSKKILLSVERVNTLSGLSLTKEEIKDILTGIEYDVEEIGEDLSVTPPTFRQDIQIPEDIYEDISRIYGFNNVNVTLPTKTIKPAQSNPLVDFKDEIRRVLGAEGANEILTYNFIGETLLKKANLNTENVYHIKNSLSPDTEYMRPSLLPSILERVSENKDRGYTDISLFEINIGHNKAELNEENLPLERWVVSHVIANQSGFVGSPFYGIKAYLTALVDGLYLRSFEYKLLADIEIEQLPFWMKNISKAFNKNSSAVVSYEIESKTYYLGIVGELTNSVKKTFKLPEYSAAYELDVKAMYEARESSSRYQEPSKYPKISQDLCFSLNSDIAYIEIENEVINILKTSKAYYEYELIDIYSPEKNPEKKQITFRVTLQSREKTLENSEFEKIKNKIEYLLKDKFKASLI